MGRYSSHMRRFNLRPENALLKYIVIGDEKESYYEEHEILAGISDEVPHEKILNETAGGYGNLNGDDESSLVYAIFAKEYSHDFGPGHNAIDFHSWNPPMLQAQKTQTSTKIMLPDLSQFRLPKFDCRLSTGVIAKMLGYETRLDVQRNGGVKKIVCWNCGIKFTRATTFREHFQHVHNKKPRTKGGIRKDNSVVFDAKKANPKYTKNRCSHCGLCFVNNEYLIEHEKSHRTSNEIECHTCGGKFKNQKR